MNEDTKDYTGEALQLQDVVSINPDVLEDHEQHEGYVVSLYPETQRVQVYVPAFRHHLDLAAANVKRTGDTLTSRAQAQQAPAAAPDEPPTA